ncbi:unnamed protein product [Linum tenue]|uniref:ABC transporter domain-containing protein n=1 Tax=Linum tenue TaxID=586396 RepID=A0AAV0P6E6_9ROSI|nr:unnamed protein product [Linum tenue]
MDQEETEVRYTIKAKKLSYRLSRTVNGGGSWLQWWKQLKPIDVADEYILRNVEFEARAGEIMAIAGPSGAGKTTLLQILGGSLVTGCRQASSRVSGEVLVNEKPMNASWFRRISGYVTQDEALFPLLTVEEMVLYAARLRLGGGVQLARARAEILLKELALERVASVRIGDEASRGISGGEKRRVSIAVELVHNPAVLLIDEPTSGLDSGSALNVVQLLQSMAADHGKTIVLTIHQPGFRILKVFDWVLLLSNGAALYEGTLASLEERLISAGCCIPRHVNVLEFAIDVLKTLRRDDGERSEDHSSDEDELCYDVHMKKTRVSYSNGRFTEVWILGQRFFSIICRTNQLFTSRMVQALAAGLVLGTIFMNGRDEPNRYVLETQVGFFAFSLTFLLSSTTEALPIFLQERRILLTEISKGSYRVSSYIVSNALVFIPFLFVVAALYSLPTYWLIGLRRDIDGFLYFLLVVWLVVMMSNSMVACFSALVRDFITGTSLIACFMGSFFLFSGYFIAKDDMPEIWVFMHYLSLFKYPLECFMINEYGGEQGKRRCLEFVDGICSLDGQGFLKLQGLKESQKWSNIAVMLSFIFAYRFLCFLILLYRSQRMRN